MSCSRQELTKEPTVSPDEFIVQPLFDQDELSVNGALTRIFVIKATYFPADIQLLLSHSLGEMVLMPEIIRDTCIFNVPSTLLKVSGQVHLSLIAEGSEVFKDDLYIAAGDPDGLIEAFASPKSVRIDSEEDVEFLSIATDAYGNLCEDGQSIQLVLNQTSQRVKRYAQKIADGYGQFRVSMPYRQVGKLMAASNAGRAFSDEKEFLITSGKPARLEVVVTDYFPYADGRQNVVVATKDVKDQYGNIVSDGTEVKFRVSDDSGYSSFYQSFVINGKANALIRNPDEPGTLHIEAMTSDQNRSKAVDLKFQANIIEIPAVAAGDSIVIGPVIGGLGQIVTDGTELMVYLSSSDHSFQRLVQTNHGMAIITDFKDKLTAEEYSLEISGGGKKVNFQFSNGE